jgi:hypothetical protein
LEKFLDGVEDRSGDLRLRRLGDDALSIAGHEHDLVLAGIEADVATADVVEDDEIGVLRLEHRALALESIRAVLGPEHDEHLTVTLLRAERARDVLRR